MKVIEYSRNEQRSCDTLVLQQLFPEASMHTGGNKAVSTLFVVVVTVAVTVIELLFNYKCSLNEY